MANTKSRLTRLENQADNNDVEIRTVLFLPSLDPERPHCLREGEGDRFLTRAEYDALPHDDAVIVRPWTA